MHKILLNGNRTIFATSDVRSVHRCKIFFLFLSRFATFFYLPNVFWNNAT